MSETPDQDSGYYAVIFSSRRPKGDANGDKSYADMARHLEALVRSAPGYLGLETARDSDGFGITVSYWENEEAIRNWKRQVDHSMAQRRGKEEWYTEYSVRVAKVERAYAMNNPGRK